MQIIKLENRLMSKHTKYEHKEKHICEIFILCTYLGCLFHDYFRFSQ